MANPNPASPKEQDWTEGDAFFHKIVVAITSVYWVVDFVSARLIDGPARIVYIVLGIYMFITTMLSSITLDRKREFEAKISWLRTANNLAFLLQGVITIAASFHYTEPASTICFAIGFFTTAIALTLILFAVDQEYSA